MTNGLLGESKFWTKWDETIKQFSLQLHFKPQPKKPVGPTFVPVVKSGYDPMQPKPTAAPSAPTPTANKPPSNYAYFNK